jgi:hypothetical protein
MFTYSSDMMHVSDAVDSNHQNDSWSNDTPVASKLSQVGLDVGIPLRGFKLSEVVNSTDIGALAGGLPKIPESVLAITRSTIQTSLDSMFGDIGAGSMSAMLNQTIPMGTSEKMLKALSVGDSLRASLAAFAKEIGTMGAFKGLAETSQTAANFMQTLTTQPHFTDAANITRNGLDEISKSAGILATQSMFQKLEDRNLFKGFASGLPTGLSSVEFFGILRNIGPEKLHASSDRSMRHLISPDYSEVFSVASTIARTGSDTSGLPLPAREEFFSKLRDIRFKDSLQWIFVVLITEFGAVLYLGDRQVFDAVTHIMEFPFIFLGFCYLFSRNRQLSGSYPFALRRP